MTHTKGPWEADGLTVYIPKSKHSSYAAYAGTEANASLIAQAPTLHAENQELKAINAELLEACRQALYILGDLTRHNGSTVAYGSGNKFAVEAMRIYEAVLPEAIAKAEGR